MLDLSPRDAITQTVDRLDPPSAEWRRNAAAGAPSAESHDALKDEAACLNALRVVQPPAAPETEAPRQLRIAAWNLERCKHVEESARLLRRAGADICLLSEMDLGMARSGNRDTTADLAGELGLGHAYGVEFIELGHGDPREEAAHADTPNQAGLHGNAVATRFAIDRTAMLPLDGGGLWFAGDDAGKQRRVGGRMAVAVRHLLPEPLWVIAAHFESRLDALDRDREMRVLLAHVGTLCGEEPVLIGGDFNCKSIQEAGLFGEEVLKTPHDGEPMFTRMAEAGFDWWTCNSPGVTTRRHSWQDQANPRKKLDWFFSRGLTCSSARVVPAVDRSRGNLSDHELILVTLEL
ncbi:MAG: endonuclease/exonuclease/phosphatase family protein [Kiloniellaceae bacterium]